MNIGRESEWFCASGQPPDEDVLKGAANVARGGRQLGSRRRCPHSPAVLDVPVDTGQEWNRHDAPLITKHTRFVGMNSKKIII